ncbi:MAG: hypothetical protein RIC03_22825 [Cyclobacteriaceae bacterium]
MTLDQIHRLNGKFQHKTAQISELMPGGNLVEFASVLIRNSRRMDTVFTKMLAVQTQSGLGRAMARMEEEMDEIIFMLDQMDLANKKRNIKLITELVKEGYELLSIYSICCDQLLEKRLKREEQ